MHPDLATAEDWITIWQSEAAALCVDRELQEATQRAIDTAAVHLRAALKAADDAAAGPSGPVPPPGTAALDAAPDERDARIRALEHQVAELERRLAGS